MAASSQAIPNSAPKSEPQDSLKWKCFRLEAWRANWTLSSNLALKASSYELTTAFQIASFAVGQRNDLKV